jgi:hypothetical protein
MRPLKLLTCGPQNSDEPMFAPAAAFHAFEYAAVATCTPPTYIRNRPAGRS